jgi:CubicO group peptidase (beta-lactamase class C family)
MSTVARTLRIALITFGLSVLSSTGAGTDPLDPAFRLVREAVEKDEVPGAIALVARGGIILRHEAFGLRDIESQLPFTTNTLCWIASITKPVTVAAAMMLVDAEKLALDDPVERYLPEFRDQKDTNAVHHAFTIRQLMSHTSGLVPNPPTRRSGWPIGGPLDDFWLQQKLPEIVHTIARSQLRFKPGSQFEYCNSALFVLGRVIEVVSGKPYAAYVKGRILEPLGMTDTHYAPPPTEAKRAAVIYARRDGKRETIFRFNPAVKISNTAPDGGLFSYPAQFVPFLQMFLDNDGRVLSRSAVAEMLKPQPHGWGLGWSLQEGLFLHEGSSGTVAWADPKTGAIGILFLQYRDQNKSDELLRKQFREAVREAFADTKKPEAYFPPPESEGGWRKLDDPKDIQRLAGMDPDKLAELKQWLLDSDKRDFAAVVIRHGHIALEVERGNSAKTDPRRVASLSKAICATVLAIASEQSQQGLTPRKMKFDDPAFRFIPWAQPLSDPRKEKITVKQLLNHTSGICPEAAGAPNDGTWEYILGHSGDERTAKLAFDPGAGCGYSTHALAHAALLCETVTGTPYDQFAIEALFKPIGIEHWWFQFYDGAEKYGRHASHGMGMPARDLARIAYCMLRDGRWKDRQVIPKWFVDETAAPTHDVKTPELRWKLNPQIFSHGWELPARLTGEGGRSGAGIPGDARAKPGSGGQYIAFVPRLDLVVTRQTGSSGEWQFEEYLRRACAALSGATVTNDPQSDGSSLPKTPSIGATRQRGHAQAEVTRPKHFPHRMGKVNYLYLNLTKDARRNDGGDTPFAAGHQVDDLFFFVQPDGGEPVELLIDEVVLFDAGDEAGELK